MKGRSTSKSLLSQAVSDSCLQHQENIVVQQAKDTIVPEMDNEQVRVVDANWVGVGLSHNHTSYTQGYRQVYSLVYYTILVI